MKSRDLGMRLLVASAILLGLAGCHSEREPIGGATPLTAERIDLSSMATAEDPAVGVAFDQAGRQLVLTRFGKIFEVTADELTLVHEVQARIAPYGFTDLAFLEGNQFALSSQSDGFLLDLSTGTLEQHFCFEPGWEEPGPGEPTMVQTSYALTAAAGVIYAQPHTTPLEEPADIRASFFATYDAYTGTDLSWFETGPRTVGGMAYIVEPIVGAKLLTGYRDELSLVNIWTEHGQIEQEYLGVLGIDEPVDIQGLAVDAANNRLVFIDRNSNELRVLPFRETLEAARQRQAENQPLGS